MTKKKRKFGSLIVAAINIIIVAAIAIFEFSGGHSEDYRSVKIADINLVYLLGAIGCFILMLVFETLKYWYMLKKAGHSEPLSLGFKTAILGKYFDNITPAGAGGQPFQMSFLKNNGCSAGVAGSLPIIGFLGLQFSFVLIGAIVLIFVHNVPPELLSIRIMAWIGLLFYAFVPTCIIIFSVIPLKFMGVIRFFTKVLHKLHIVKDPEKATEKAREALASYSDCLKQYRNQPKLIIFISAMSLLFQICVLSMPWFVLRAFGATIDFLPCFTQVANIYAAITIIPTPGNSGAAEVSFYMVFNALREGRVFIAMLIWRVLCYYSWLLCGALYFIYNIFEKKKPITYGSPGKNIDGVLITLYAKSS